MKRIICIISLILCISCSQKYDIASWKKMEKPLNFYLVNDLGRNGYYDQKEIAGTMGMMAENIDIEFVLAAGDIHHFEGVRSVDDPLWMTNYELIYNHPDLMIPWYAVCGNHEYRGNTEAVTAYSAKSARWNVPSDYYTFVKEEDGTTLRVIMIDTAPMIDKYREDSLKYHDAHIKDYKKQLQWLDSVLVSSKEDWIIVAGHHPVYAQTDKDDSERKDLQERLDTLLNKYGNVDMYLSGHIHNFQHIRKEGSDIDYIVNTSGSLARDVSPTEGTVFCSSSTGYSLIGMDKETLVLHMLDKKGNVLHTVARNKHIAK